MVEALLVEGALHVEHGKVSRVFEVVLAAEGFRQDGLIFQPRGLVVEAAQKET